MIKLCFLADADTIHTIKWVDYFSEKGYDISLISMRDTKYKYPKNVKLYVVEPPFKNKLSYLMLIGKIKKLINEIKPDILHSHYATSYGLLGMASGFHPFAISAWGSDIYEFPNLNKFNKILLKRILNSADAVCSTSYAMAEEMKKYYEKDIAITPFGVDTNKFSCTIPVLSKEFITIGIAKNLHKVYGVEYLVRAFADLCDEWKADELRLLIVGDGSEKESLEQLSKELGISSKVQFTGNVDNDKVPEYLNKMDIVCIPSINESFGVAAVEAAACSRPVIASNIGGLKEIVLDEFNGYLVEVQNSKDIKDKILNLLKDKNKLIEFSQNTREFILEKYDWESNAKIMEELYFRMI